MSGEAAIRAGRRLAESRMRGTCEITRVAGRTFDETTATYTPTTITVYTGPCRLKFASNRVATRQAEGQIAAVQQLLLYLPVDGSEGVVVDDVALITDGGLDTALTGRRVRIAGLFAQSDATARRLPVESLA